MHHNKRFHKDNPLSEILDIRLETVQALSEVNNMIKENMRYNKTVLAPQY